MYKKTAKMSRHELCLNGIYSYYIEMIVPHMRKAGHVRLLLSGA